MKIPRRQFLHLAASVAGLPALPGIAWGQAYPTRPIHILVGFAPGGGADILARLVAQWLSERLGRQFVVENHVGAASNIATEAAVNAAPDGYTLAVISSTNAINATLYEKLNFDLIRDIAPVAGVMRLPNVMLVNSSFQAKTVPEFISYAKTNPGKINFGSGGSGTSVHMATEWFKMLAGVDIVHVPYRGEAPALTDLLSGQLQVLFGTVSSSLAHVKAGTLRALAVTTTSRSEALPDVLTLAEFLPGYEMSYQGGIGAPKNTPTGIIGKLNTEINASLAHPKTRARLADLGAAPLAGSPTDFGKLIADEIEKWGKVIKFAGIKAQ